MNIMDKPVPDFAIFQNDRTRVSGLWIKEAGEWRECPATDFESLRIITEMIRNSPDPEHTLIMIAKVISKIDEGEDFIL